MESTEQFHCLPLQTESVCVRPPLFAIMSGPIDLFVHTPTRPYPHTQILPPHSLLTVIFFKCQLLFTYVLITCDVALSHGVSCLLSFVVQLCEGESVTRVTLSVFVISCQTFVQLKSLLCLIARQKCGRCFPYAYLQTATAGS